MYFDGQCEAALTFYQQVLGAKLALLMRFADSPEPLPAEQLPVNGAQGVMHAQLRLGDTQIMVADGARGNSAPSGFRLSLTAPTAQAAQAAAQMFNVLAEEGRVEMPLGPTFWSPCFGVVVDTFNLGWMITVPESPHA